MTAQDAWSAAIGDRVEHQDGCWLDGGGCSAPFGSNRPTYCPTGQGFADAEHERYLAWRAERAGLAVAS